VCDDDLLRELAGRKLIGAVDGPLDIPGSMTRLPLLVSRYSDGCILLELDVLAGIYTVRVGHFIHSLNHSP